jgi:enhancing lycopene biosynthesis protein 2
MLDRLEPTDPTNLLCENGKPIGLMCVNPHCQSDSLYCSNGTNEACK